MAAAWFNKLLAGWNSCWSFTIPADIVGVDRDATSRTTGHSLQPPSSCVGSNIWLPRNDTVFYL